jgi:hypothetical protein
MTRNNADFQNHIRLHRGVADTTVDQLLSSPRNLGKHWTEDEDSALHFAQQGTSGVGAVVTAMVHPDDFMTPEEVAKHNDTTPWKQIYLNDTRENETPVRPGTTVHVVEGKDIHYFDEPQVTNQRTFKTPRQAKA